MKNVDKTCYITTGKLDANQAVRNGDYPFFTCAQFPDKIDTYAFDDDVVLVAGNNANGNFHVSRFKGKFNAYQRTYVLTAKKGEDIDYIYYSLKLELKRLRERSQGSQTKFLTMPILTNIMINDIKYNDQLAISSVLSRIDRKIELNNKIINELEAIAKLLYDYWFVQLDFPDENGKPYKSSGGNMVFNEELNQYIPQDWTISLIKELFTSKKSGDWGKETAQNNFTLEVYCIRGADLGGMAGEGEEKAPIRFIHKNNKDKILSNFDMVIEISGGSPTQSTGRIAAITKELQNRFQHPLICSNFCKPISINDSDYFYNFLYQWKSFYNSGLFFKWEGKTSGIKNLLFENFVDNYKIAKPPKEIVKNFNRLILPLEKKKQNLLIEIKELKSLRDWLLPMLMNGQVTISDAS